MNYKMLDENVSSLVFGIASPVAIALVFIIHFHVKANALNTWILSLVFSLMGVSLLMFDTPFALNAGSFFCGLGDSTSFIITSFMCGGAIKLSKSLKMYRIFCLIHFIQYIVLSGLLILINEHFAGMSQIVGFGIVVSLCCLCFSMLPYLQRKIFDSPWTDGLKLADMIEYVPAIAEAE